jgi:drug/metabolite transporter (DMT)-like permease
VDKKGLIALLFGMFLFSTIEVASKLMQTGGGVAGQYPFWLACLRFIITGLVLTGPAVRQLRRRTDCFSWKDAAALAGLGCIGVSIMSSLFHLAITFLPANIAALIFSCNPVFVVLLAPLVLPEKITVRKLIAVCICLSGIAVLANDRGDRISGTGVLLMLAAILVFSVYTILFKKMIPRYGALPITALGGLTGGLLILPVALPVEGFAPAMYTPADWIGILYLGIPGTALAYLLYIYGIGHTEAGIGSMTFFLKPFLAALLAWWILGEHLGAVEMGGGALILLGMAVALVPIRRQSSKGWKNENNTR